MTARAGELVGIASVIDADTIELHGTRIRLVGIDAPEGRQTCELDGQPWRCGQALLDCLCRARGCGAGCEARDMDERVCAAVGLAEGELTGTHPGPPRFELVMHSSCALRCGFGDLQALGWYQEAPEVRH